MIDPGLAVLEEKSIVDGPITLSAAVVLSHEYNGLEGFYRKALSKAGLEKVLLYVLVEKVTNVIKI